MSKIPIAIVGVGNCASSLVQGISFYGGSPRNGASVGLMHQQVGPYWPDDIEVVAAFDVDRRKVGIDVSEAIFAPPNCTKVFCEKIGKTGTIVRMGCVLDGVGTHMSEYDPGRTFQPLEKESTRERIIAELRESGAQIMVNYLPVGSEEATRFYVGLRARSRPRPWSTTSQSLSRATRFGRSGSKKKISRSSATTLRHKWGRRCCTALWLISSASAA